MNEKPSHRFPVNSQLLELLIELKEGHTLSALAEIFAKDRSVISRRLQQLADEYPIIEKVNGKWQPTQQGRLIAEETVLFLQKIAGQDTSRKVHNSLFRTANPALIVINAQKGLGANPKASRNNPSAENCILELLRLWRQKTLPVFHVRHISENSMSTFYRQSAGAEYIDSLSPLSGETELIKSKSSAFSGTRLQEILQTQNCSELVLVGFTANDCIDSTARQASDEEFTTFVVSDATAIFDFESQDGATFAADRIHRLVMANLEQFYAKVLGHEQILSSLS